MRCAVRRAAVGLIAAAVLIGSFFLPVLSFSLWDRSQATQISSAPLQLRTADRGAMHICQMLRMAYATDKQTFLTRGKYLTPNEAFAQAKAALYSLDALETLEIDWNACTLQEYSITFRISSDDLSKRTTLWNLTIAAPNGAAIRVCLDDRTGIVLGFSYSNQDSPFHTGQIPPVEIQILGASLVDSFASYWGLSVHSTTVVIDGGYLVTLSDEEHGESLEIPYVLGPAEIRINTAS